MKNQKRHKKVTDRGLRVTVIVKKNMKTTYKYKIDKSRFKKNLTVQK